MLITFPYFYLPNSQLELHSNMKFRQLFLTGLNNFIDNNTGSYADNRSSSVAYNPSPDTGKTAKREF